MMINYMKHLIFLALFLISTGCSSIAISEKPHPEARGVNDKYLSCDMSFFKNGNSNGTRYGPIYQKYAKETWHLALMSSNAYEDVPLFFIKDWYLINRYESGKGFAADVYEKRDKNKKVTQVVIAFRGTEFTSITDWIYGNLNLYWEGQYSDARDLINLVKNNQRYTNIPIVVTGHSLGGGLALHISLHYSGINAYVFNTSPRVFSPDSSSTIPNNIRVLISEDKEILSNIINDSPAVNASHITKKLNDYDFLKDNLIAEHGMYYLARGLLYTAASYDDTDALNALERNIGCII